MDKSESMKTPNNGTTERLPRNKLKFNYLYRSMPIPNNGTMWNDGTTWNGIWNDVERYLERCKYLIIICLYSNRSVVPLLGTEVQRTEHMPPWPTS